MSYRSRQHIRSLKHERGVAIIVALFIVALVATMAYVMMARLQRDTERTNLIVRNTQQEMIAQGSILWAIESLRKDWDEQQPKKLIDVMPMTSPAINADGFQVSSVIEDMQSRFNINNLASNQGLNEFIRLLQIANPELSQEKAMAIMQSIIVWISQGAPSREANDDYFARPQPYRNAGRKMLTVSELSMVQGITPGLYAVLAPNLSALPEDTKINVQTATLPVLMSLSPSMTPEIAKQIIEVRQAQPFTSIDVFMNLDVIKNNHISTDDITVTSSYFLVKTEVKIENQQLVIYTLLCRAIKDNKADIVIVWQSKGTV